MPRKTLTREQIVDAAVAVLDSDGVDGLNMRRLGAQLGAAATAMYWHVKSRDELVVLAGDHVWNEMAAGLLWFRYRTDRTVGTACLMIGVFLIVSGLCKLVLSGLYGDFAGYLVMALGAMTLLFRRRWNLLPIGAALCFFGILNVASVLWTWTHPTLTNASGGQVPNAFWSGGG